MVLLTNVCRLCLVTEDLVWVFDRKLPGIHNNSLKDIIFATSGVEIYDKDMISQKICSKCCQISMKMFQFREQSMKNDMILKNQYAELLKNAKVKLKIPNTDITITAEKVETKIETKNDTSTAKYRIHPSVTALFKDNPKIRLPSVCLKSNISPCVSLEMDAVEKYLRNRRLSKQKFSKLASNSTRKVAKKKGSAKPISKPKTVEIRKISPLSSSKKVDPLQIVSTMKPASVKENIDKLPPTNIRKYREKSYKIVNVSKIIAQDNSKSSDDSDNSTRQEPVSLKRKLSTDDSSTELEPKKPAFVESLGLTPTLKPNGDSTGTLYVDNNKSVPLFICDICNSVQYNAKDLKKHMLKHLRCQFCKLKFKSMEVKISHIGRYCRIKNMMNHLPAVELEKIEFKLKVRRKYPEAFSGFPSLPGLELEKHKDTDNSSNHEMSMSVDLDTKNDSDNNLSDEKTTSGESIQKHTENPIPESSDIIEIISDDEDTTPPLVSELSTAVSEILIGSSKQKECSRDVSSSLSRYPSPPATVHNTGATVGTIVNTTKVSSEIPIAITTPLPISTTRNPLLINQSYSVPVTLQTKSATDLEQNSSPYVKPEILIKNVSILDKFDAKATDTNVVKDLLIQLGRLQSDGTTQTELPSNDSIIVNKGSRTISLRNLRYMLLMYKIPVHINKGDFKISYKYETPALRKKKHRLWDDLVAIDYERTNDSINAISSKTTAPLNPDSESSTPAAVSFNSNSAVTIQQSPNINNEIATVMISSQTNTYCSGAPVTENVIISPSTPSVMSYIQNPSIPFTPNSSSITSELCSINSVSVDSGNASLSIPISSEGSDTQTPSISFATVGANTSGQPLIFINTINTNAGHVTVGNPISSGMSCIQAPAVSFNPNSSSISGQPAFLAVISTPNHSEMSSIQQQNISLNSNSLSISSPSALSVNNINPIAGNTTTGTAISSGIGCNLPSSSISEISYSQPPNIVFNSSSSSISNLSAHSINNINAIAGNTTSATPISSGIGCSLPSTSISEISYMQPPNILFSPSSFSISNPQEFSINNVNAIAGNTTPGTSSSSGTGCIQPSSSISLGFPTTSGNQIALTSDNTDCILTSAVTNTHPNTYTSAENITAMNVPIIVQDDLPISASTTLVSASTTLVSASTTLVSASTTLVSAPTTLVSASTTLVNAPTPISAPPTPVSVPLTPDSTQLMPVSAALDSSAASPWNVLPTAIVTESNSVTVANSVPVANSDPVANNVAVTGRVGIRVKNLCELT